MTTFVCLALNGSPLRKPCGGLGGAAAGVGIVLGAGAGVTATLKRAHVLSARARATPETTTYLSLAAGYFDSKAFSKSLQSDCTSSPSVRCHLRADPSKHVAAYIVCNPLIVPLLSFFESCLLDGFEKGFALVAVDTLKGWLDVGHGCGQKSDHQGTAKR